MVVPQHPNANKISANVVQEVVRKAIQITASKPTPIKMEPLRILDRFIDSNLKLRKEVLPKLAGNLIVLLQNLVQIRLNSPVESNIHDGEAQPPIRRK